MKKIFFLMLIIALSLFFLFIINNYFSKKNSSVSINGTSFKVIVAKTDNQKEKGLSIYKSLPENEGMIFPFEKADYYSFWMKGMKFSIDIIYIKDNKIVQIFKRVPYPKTSSDKLTVVTPKEKSNYILEINSGFSDKYKFKEGDKVEINLK